MDNVEVGSGFFFPSIPSPAAVDTPISMGMETDSRAIHSPFSSSSPLLPFASCVQPALEIEIRGDLLCKYIESAMEDPVNIRMPSWEEPTTIFFSVTKPSVPHEVFIKRLVRRAKISKRGFVYALMYLEKLRTVDVKLTLSPYNIHRLLVTALVIAGKQVDDNSWLENLLSIVSVSEMDRLESVILSMLEYNLHIDGKDYSRFVSKLTNT